MNIVSATWKDAAHTLVDATFADVQSDMPGQPNYDVAVVDLEIAAPAKFPRAISDWIAAGNSPAPFVSGLVLSQDLMAQFTAADAAKIQTAVGANPQFWLLWSAMQAQKDPMEVGNARFLVGWSALVAVLGADRMAAIATALGVKVA